MRLGTILEWAFIAVVVGIVVAGGIVLVSRAIIAGDVALRLVAVIYLVFVIVAVACIVVGTVVEHRERAGMRKAEEDARRQNAPKGALDAEAAHQRSTALFVEDLHADRKGRQLEEAGARWLEDDDLG